MSRTGNFDKSCIHSVVRNISGRTLRFGFLPPHGQQLTNNEEFTCFGNILSRITERRSQQAFQAALDRGDLELLQTPAPILRDSVTGANKMLTLASGSLSTADPCWATSDSLDVATPA